MGRAALSALAVALPLALAGLPAALAPGQDPQYANHGLVVRDGTIDPVDPGTVGPGFDPEG